MKRTIDHKAPVVLIAGLITFQFLPLAGSASAESARLQFVAPEVPQNPGEPGGRGRGGGSRGDCKKYQSLTALVPLITRNSQTFPWGLTTQAHPTFWFYLPAPLTAQTPLRFVLRDRQDQTLYSTIIHPVTTAAGIIRIPVPTSVPALESGKTYRWGLSVQCDAGINPDYVFVRGVVQRVSLPNPIAQQLQSATTPLEQASIYGKQGIWFDAITTLGNARTTDAAVLQAWKDLLRQGHLESLLAAPFTPCCTPK